MEFLTPHLEADWRELGRRAEAAHLQPTSVSEYADEDSKGGFCFFIGSLLAAHGRGNEARPWFLEGAQHEQDLLMANTYMLSFLERRKGRFQMPAVAFEDPRPFVHFSTTPEIVKTRQAFIKQVGHALPEFRRPLSVMDIGTGNGALLVSLLRHLLEVGKAEGIGEILLIDASKAMTELARETVGKAFGASMVKAVHSRFETFSERLEGHYDLAISSLAYHHMPFELKLQHMKRLREHIDHFMILEMDANHDTPEVYSPELAYSVYQAYGRAIDFVFSHDAEVAVAQSSVDCFLMTEALSLLTQPRGVRTEYHMLRRQWHELFEQGLGSGFTCMCEATCYSDTFLDLFTLHYGR